MSSLVLLLALSKILNAVAFSNPSTVRWKYGGKLLLSSVVSSGYAEARFVRTQQGHEAAQPLYQRILDENPNDITAATRIAAAPETSFRHDLSLASTDLTALRRDAEQLNRLLTASRYFNYDIIELLGLPRALANDCAGPGVFLTPASAGTSTKLPFASESPEALECLVAMFILALAVPLVTLQQAIGHDAVDLFKRLGLAFPCQTDPALIVPYLHIFPLTLPGEATKPQKTLWLLTDLHPRVLSATTVGTKEHGTVMYIGPDSLALFQNFITSLSALKARPSTVLDLCAGSGVQALAALSTMESIQSAIMIDINPRALRISHFNAALNGLDDRLNRFVVGDLVSGQGRHWHPCEEALSIDSSPLLGILMESTPRNQCDHLLVLANPPFLPVPTHDMEIRKRYGLFSDGGGPSGERVLQAIVELSAATMNQANSTAVADVGIVSEFVNPPFDKETSDSHLLHRLQKWWVSPRDCSARGILFTNEYPVDAPTYAQRRADNSREAQTWYQHLKEQGISHISPGLLYMRATRRTEEKDLGIGEPKDNPIQIKHFLIPKTRSGSIWTPNNQEAFAFIHERAIALWS